MLTQQKSTSLALVSLQTIAITTLILLLAGPVSAQSIDDIHVAPRAQKSTSAPESTLADVSIGRSPLRPRPIRHDVELVLVPVTVTDSFNRLVTDLHEEDFRLEEAQKGQKIRYFSVEDAPISLGILVDLSSSMKDKIDDVRDAAVEFLENSNPEDDCFVITFSYYPELLADSTRSVGHIRERLATAEPKGQTALLDAIYMGINKLQHARYNRRALLIISDGGDNNSRYTEREIRRIVQESDVEIYSVGVFTHGISLFLNPEDAAGKHLLKDISEVTGGRMIELKSSKDLPDIARQIGIELRSQYLLGYAPGNGPRDGSWRDIQVSLAAAAAERHDLRVHAKKGYLGPGR